MFAIQLGIIGFIFYIVSFIFYAKINDVVFALGMFFSAWLAILSFCYYFISKIIYGGDFWLDWFFGIAFVVLAVYRAYEFVKLYRKQ